MFKRANKITALLVAAASVMSIVPAMASDVKKVDSQDGTIYDAVAYKDGSALIDGDVNDNDATYYLADGKYNELSDVESGSDYAAYGTKYAKIDDGSDYNVDLEKGTVIDDDVASNDEDDAASALRKEIKDTDRYVDASSTTAPFGDSDIADLTVLKGNKFGETWYSTSYKTEAGQFAYTAAAASTNIYTDGKGNYIDADYNVGKIKVSTTSAAGGVTTSASVTIENSKDKYDLRGTKDTYVQVLSSSVLGQDADNIYRYAKIKITSVADATGYIYVNGKAFTPAQLATGLDVIQKISKTQDSDNVDDGKYANTVTNYVISNDDTTQTGDAATYLALATNAATEAKVINGKLALYKVTNTSTADNVAVQAATLKSKNGYYYTDTESQTTIQAEYSSDLNRVAVDTDVDGNIYVLDGGYVKEFDGTDDWNKVYKVDGSFDSLSVYDKNNIVTWSQGDEIYSVIGGKKAADDTTTGTTTTTTTVEKSGWVQATNGTWAYNKADGTKTTGWFQDTTGTWYYASADGTMVANGWAQYGSTWYYLGGSGAMATNAWIQYGSDWYYVGGTGAMLTNTTVGGYVLGASGAWVR